MLNIKKGILIICLLLGSFLSFAQKSFINNTYTTYSTKTLPKHSLFIEHQKVSLKLPSKGLFPEKNINFISEIKNDTIYIFEEKKGIEQAKGIKLANDKLVSKFANTRFYRKSKNAIVQIETERVYFNKTAVDSILGNQIIYAVNNEILKSEKDATTLKNILDKKKFKVKKLKIRKGEKAIKRYGILALNGIIEIKGKYKKCR
ncbi:hypothetical protein [Tenacibaculum ovolyticum]|uniref:hypothetical protein n=1 Tax=Tenacibaculum ovolyticum TaxID=104270 RepID=UPI003BAA9D16